VQRLVAILEKWVFVLTAIVVVTVVVLAKLGPIKSEISKQTVLDDTNDENQGNAFLDHARRRNTGQVAFDSTARSNLQSGARPGPGGAQARAPGSAKPAAPGQAPGANPPQQAPLQQPWVNQQQPPPPPLQAGVQPTIYVPSSAVEKYQHFDDLVELGNTAVGGDVDYQGQTAFQIRDISEGSPLANQLGFQPNDVIISVNGYPASMGNARQLYETLKNEKQFQVEIDRAGQRMTIPYHVR
jgi:hypothetical protein